MNFRKTLVSLLGLLLFIGGCSTVDKAKLEQTEDVAVTLIGVDEYIDLTKVQGSGTIMQRLLDDESFDLSPMVDKLHNEVFDSYAQTLPVDIMSEDRVIHTDRYQNFQLFDREASSERFQESSRIITPEGYKNYPPSYLSGNKIERFFDAVPQEAEAIMFVNADYAFKEDTSFLMSLLPFGAKQSVVEATVTLEMVDRSGNTIMKIRKSASSDEKMNMVGGLNLETDKIQELCVSASEKAFAETKRYLNEELSG